MAGLKFTSENCEIASEVGARELVSVSIALPAADWTEFAERLGEIENREGSEFRSDFPGGWTLFWKVRDGDSRFFVAHPETDQWVGTLAISASHLALVRERMRAGFSGALSELERVSRMSNLEVRISTKGGQG
jgi:hypothetical protein